MSLNNAVEHVKSDNLQEYSFKVLVVGEKSVGKTSIIQRYTKGEFFRKCKPTLGADFASKVIDWDSKTQVHLHLWDIGGHERYGHMTRVYYKMAAFIVFDLCRPNTWNMVLKWYDDLKQNVLTEDGSTIPIVLLANKCDEEDAKCDNTILTTFCDELGFNGWLPVSAKTNRNIDEAMDLIIREIFTNQPEKKCIRPGTPWFRAESPMPMQDIAVYGNDKEENMHSVVAGNEAKQSRCC
ncbi:ras-related protein Rab-32-like isoform X2 [Xenia sp. Carnegie-2017]|uniref:ras-related protein Rab-32-like isoform X2 n=1 Tax=Xenia sp. Carnegie-2017 TaxID=2897299 RepID=UPI001F043AF6|nr:ras-related protein Rab-32-like isoform X2 [Xenia sp. Carnegie-2017]